MLKLRDQCISNLTEKVNDLSHGIEERDADIAKLDYEFPYKEFTLMNEKVG